MGVPVLASHLFLTVNLTLPSDWFWILAVAFLLPHPLYLFLCQWLDPVLENSQWLSPNAVCLAWSVLPWSVGLWNVLVAEWDQSADKHSSTAVEIRDRQVAARG